MAAAPDELSLNGVLWRDGPVGGPGFTLFVAWTGDPDLAESQVGSFRRRSDVIYDELGPLSYLDLQLLGDRGGPAHREYGKAQFVDAISPGLIDAIEAADEQIAPGDAILMEPIYGQAHRIPAELAAFGAREAVANISALASWDDPADDEARIRWSRESVASWEPFSLRGGGYLNYASADESATRVEGFYGAERFARLRAVKRRCDPDNRFRFNANIPPA